MNPLTWTLLITSLSTSTVIVMSSHHWLLAWLGLELNSLSILPLIMKQASPRATEAATKYFLTQATAAALILFAAALNALETGQWSILHCPTTCATITMTLAMMLKLGIAPAHFWYPEAIQGSTLTTALLLSTWQKLAPLALLYMTLPHLPTQIMLTLGLMSAMLGGWMGLNQTQTRKILAFSSIAHMGWLITALSLSPNLATLTMITYIIMTTSIFIMMIKTATKTLANLSHTWSHSPTMTTTTMLALMSLGGLPPFTGFAPKWLILKTLTTTDLILIGTALALASLPSLFFYIRMTYLGLMTTPPNTNNTKHNWHHNTHYPPYMALMITTTLLLLPMTPMLNTA
uniref:NADH-ubiquinone oxidoreductase chain 2 n=1 Tax=Urocotyledon inexpectata TaxID=707139 RepID=J7GE55_9SAUR|nr:NADH dehydrogenase subunit 2 [Urocotyledon inexpectata]